MEAYKRGEEKADWKGDDRWHEGIRNNKVNRVHTSVNKVNKDRTGSLKASIWILLSVFICRLFFPRRGMTTPQTISRLVTQSFKQWIFIHYSPSALVLSTTDCRLIAEPCNHISPEPAGPELVNGGYVTSEVGACQDVVRIVELSTPTESRNPPWLTRGGRGFNIAYNGPQKKACWTVSLINRLIYVTQVWAEAKQIGYTAALWTGCCQRRGK